MMKKLVVLMMLIGVLGACVQAAVPAILVDDFSDTDLSEYTMNYVLVQNTNNTTSYASPSGTLQVSKPADTDAEQTLLLRDDYSLSVGETLRVDALVASVSGLNCDFGIAVATMADLPDSTGTGDRQGYINMYIKAGSSGWGCIGFDTVNHQIANTGYVTNQDLSVITGLFITRTGADAFDVGYSTASGDTVFRSLTVATGTGIGAAVGFYSDLRGEITYGDLDNLRIENPSFVAHDPTPDDAAPIAGVAQGDGTADVILSWQAGLDPNGFMVVNPDIKKHYVFMSTSQSVTLPDPNLYYIGEVAHVDYGTALVDTFPTVTDLAEGSDYLWKVLEGIDDGQGGVYGPNDPNNYDGPVWSFTTANSLPAIDEGGQPVSTMIIEDTSTYDAFTIAVTSASTPLYQWFYSADDQIGGDTEIGTDEPNLPITNASVSDEGYYYCRVANDATVSGGGSEVDIYSDVVTLAVGRIVGEYLFDEDTLADTSGNGNNGQGKSVSGLAEPNALLASDVTLGYETGVNGTGKAVVLGTDEYVDFGTAAYPKAGSLTGGVGAGLDAGTITCWVKPAQTGLVLGTYNEGLTSGFAFSLTPNGDATDTRIQVRGEAADVGTLQGRLTAKPGSDIFDTEWHLIAATWTAGGTIAVYVDGEEVIAGDAGAPALYAAWQRAVLLGASRQFASRDLLGDLYGGSVDDLKIYNYARSANEIANEYYVQTGEMACLDHDFDGSLYDVVSEGTSYCKVDLADFAEFAAKWLTSGLGTGE